MSLKQDETGRLHIDTALMAESLMDKSLLVSTETDSVFRPLPDLNVLKIGGQSTFCARTVSPWSISSHSPTEREGIQ